MRLWNWIVDRLPLIVFCSLIIIFLSICFAGLYLLIFQANLVGLLVLLIGFCLTVGLIIFLYKLTEAVMVVYYGDIN
ncbi:hypothetical protein GW933_01625 [Candidatus Falkowbacteria bacterium]|uniref:Uncharacterized protein n=1 Tax=Candidatus Buchananbacteria bacterium CG10_big_fil_rev_8_21_14_0_10_33_19 TaxID=1974525 RepID=A0A2H0W3L7_9BACT|nr:hypothetical protein [Candidatus Falkowbacteria bacterium]PIS05949.1 MAG: hypothetical protein COT80_04245 [Candidatus Buchananbacteria bacterium CG10_big_fil_rev_8_21_14_0_10_33_19]